jgi:hypothetical protein
MSDALGNPISLADVITELYIRMENSEANAAGDENCRAAGLAAAYRACIDMLFEIDEPESA